MTGRGMKKAMIVLLAAVMLVIGTAVGEGAVISSGEYLEAPVDELGEMSLGAINTDLPSVVESDMGIESSDGLVEETSAISEAENALFAQEEDGFTPNNYEISIGAKEKMSVNLGDTLDVDVEEGTVVSWSSSKRKVAEVSFDGISAHITTNGEGTAKLTAKLSNRKKCTLTLTVNDPYKPTAVHTYANEVYLGIGEEKGLLNEVYLEPSYARTTYTWKSSSSGIAKVDKNGVVTARKAGKAKITVTTQNKRKATINIVVMPNKTQNLSDAPTSGDIQRISGGWTLWPLSVEYLSTGKLSCQFYLLNGTDQKITQIENMRLYVAVGSPDNIIAYYSAAKTKASCKKNSYASIQLTIPAKNIYDNSISLSGLSADEMYFTFEDTENMRGKAGKYYYAYAPTAHKDADVKIQGLRLNYEETTLKVGETISLIPEISPDNASNRQIEWKTSDGNVAVVDNGLVSACNAGIAVITASATDGTGISAKCVITVEEKSFSVEISKTELSLNAGECYQLFAFQNPLYTEIAQMNWSSSNPIVAEVDELGNVTAKFKGTARISVVMRSKAGADSSSYCDVTVNGDAYIPVAAISLENSDDRLSVGQVLPLKAVLEPQNATNNAVTWVSSDPSIATVENGIVVGLAEGTATIRAVSDADPQKSCSLTLKVQPENNPRPIEAPEMLEPFVSGNNMLISWIGVEGATGYKVYYRTGQDIAYGFFIVEGLKTTSKALLDLSYDTEYRIHVTALRGKTESGYAADTIIRTPKEESFDIYAPVIEKTLACGNNIWVKWKNIPFAMQYEVTLRRKGSSAVYRRFTTDQNTTEYLIENLERDMEYVITVCAYVNDIKCKDSDKVTVQTEKDAFSIMDMHMSLDRIALKAGEQFTIDIVTTPGNASTTQCQWGSSNPDVASVDQNGCVTARRNGTATITATATSVFGNTIRASCEVKVKAPSYRALLIGEVIFSDGKSSRPCHKKDVELMRKVLVGRKGEYGGNWDIQTRIDRTASEIHTDIQTVFGEAEETDVSLFMITTHGVTSLPYESSAASELICYRAESAITCGELAEWLGEIKGKVIVIINACGSGGFIAENPNAGKGSLMTPQMNNESFDSERFCQDFIHEIADRDDGVVSFDSNERAFFAGDLRDKLTSQTRENKFYVITASKFQQTAWATVDEYSYFIKWLTDGVGQSGSMKADTQYAGNKDERVTLHELYTYISKVGDNYPHHVDGKTFYQTVQVYPSHSDFTLFCK